MLFVAALALRAARTPSRKTAKAARTASPQIAAGARIRGTQLHAMMKAHRPGRLRRLRAGSELVADELLPPAVSAALPAPDVALQVSCFGVIAQALPVALMDPAIGGHSSVSAARCSGRWRPPRRWSSCSSAASSGG